MQKPNIILINCDDLGYGDLGCYGSPCNKTPHIDALAARGARLTEFYMASPVCSASRAAMLTGCYPQRIGFGSHSVLFPGQPWGLDSHEATIAGHLKTVGYATKIIGKWHCGDQLDFLPTRHGFDEYLGIPYSNDMGRQVGEEERPPLPLLQGETVIQEQPDQRGLTERYTHEALKFIQRNQDQPFFLYLAHMYVHVPLFVPKPFLEASTNGAYGAAVECIDWSTGLLLDQLKQLGIFDNTLILFTSDNGSRARDEGGRNLPCRGTKATTWEGGQRVPCILHWPDQIPEGRVLEGITRSIDFLPTLCRIAGVDADNDGLPIDGVDLFDFIKGHVPSSPNDSFLYYWGDFLDAVRVGAWKLHFGKMGDPFQALYNLADDCGEEKDLFSTHPQVVRELAKVAGQAREQYGDAYQNRKGEVTRAIGEVENAQPLTEYRQDHPYMVAMYDLPDMPTMCG